MIGTSRVLGLIPARGGSKGVPRKNVRQVGGKPLLAWTIDEARRSRYLDAVVVSSDDDEIMQVARACGAEVPFRRPAELAADDTPGIAPVLHALDVLPGFDYVVLLQPTSPLRTAADMDVCLERAVASGGCCVSVTACTENPWHMFELQGSALKSVMPAPPKATRQQYPALYRLNGAVYAASVAWVRQHNNFVAPGTQAYVMPAERSLDIDTEQDLARFTEIAKGAIKDVANRS